MSLDNPYRAAGAFRGKAYIRRDADAQLIEQIEDNQYYPYFAAPRQSGKSSLLMRTMAALAPVKYRSALVDLSPFVVSSYDDFWRQFLYEVARSANFDPTPIATEDPRDVFLTWLRGCKQRLIVFMDEIDVLLNVDCREQIFSKFRTFYNMRARPDTPELERLQFVLAGAAHSSRFIKDPRWSPFNVAIEIELEDLTTQQVSQLSAYLATAGAFAGPDLTQRVFELSGGSVYLCQLMFEQLWNTAARGNPRLGAADVDAVVETIVAESPRNIHFYNIFRLVTADARLAMLFRRLTEGQELGEEEHKELRLTGICRGASPFRNEIYARVFGPGGPLDLKVGTKQIELGKQLDAALARREKLRGEPSDAAAAEAAEVEVRRLRREFREGTALQVGDVLGRGRYRVDEKIGQGGFATVWRAFDGRTQREVAIKVLHGQFAEDRSRRDRFFRGAWKMSELRHAGVVEVVEAYGEENGYYYFVMEFLRDGTLHSAVMEKKLDAARVLRIITMIGQALHYAHERGLVHRDVKPTNVLVSGDAGKLTDFDLVRETDVTHGTKEGAMGTFLYASPEVMSQPQAADARADIYGLGMTAVFALHGEDLAMDVIRDTDRFIDRLKCPPAVHAVLKKAVAWNREERYATSAEFVAELEQAAHAEVRRPAGPSDSQRAPVAEWGALAGDSVLLGLSSRAKPRPATTVPSPSRGPAPPVARASAPAPVPPRGLAEEFAAMSVVPTPDHAFDDMDTILRMPQPQSDEEESSDEEATLVTEPPTVELRRGEKAAEGRAAFAEEVLPLTGVAALVAGGAMVMKSSSVAAAREPVRAERTQLLVSDAVTSEIGAAPAVSVAAPASESAAASTSAPTPGDTMRGLAVAGDRPAMASTSGLFHANRRTMSTPEPEMKRPETPADKPKDEGSPRGVLLYVMGLAASVALIFVAQSALTGDGATSEGLVVPGSPELDEAKSTQAGLEKRPAIPDVKSDVKTAGDVADTGAGSVTSVGPSASGGSASAGSDVSGAGESVGVAEESAGSAETSGLPIAPDEGGDSRDSAVDPVHEPTAPPLATTTPLEPQTTTTTHDSGGAEVRPPITKAVSFDDLVRDGCSEVYYGDAGKALPLLKQAFNLKPRNLKMLECLARAYMALNNYESAETYFRQILKLEPRSRKALLGAAEANEKMTRLGNAALYYDQLRSQEPDNPSASKFFKANPAHDLRRPGPEGTPGP